MSPNTEPKEGTSKKRARRQKAKPKFEVPPEVAAAPKAAWVYRAENAHPAPVVALPAPNANGCNGAATRPVQGTPDPTTIMLAAIEAMAHTVAAANRLFLAAASVMGAPIEVTRKILGL